MPPSLPAVWALPGSPERAFALVDAIEPSLPRTDLQQLIVSALLFVHRYEAAFFIRRAWGSVARRGAAGGGRRDPRAGLPGGADELVGLARDARENGIDVLLGTSGCGASWSYDAMRDPALRDAALVEVVGALAGGPDGRG